MKSGHTRKSPRWTSRTGRAYPLHGTMSEYSSRKLHTHKYHQILTIRNGVTLLEDAEGRRPLYGMMCAFLPAGIPHRSIVIGNEVVYQSLYFSPSLFKGNDDDKIIIYNAGELSSALFNHLATNAKTPYKGNDLKALELFLDTSQTDMNNRSFRFSLPRARSVECAKIVAFIESKYAGKIALSDLGSVLPYTARHISRIFRNEMMITPYEYLRMFRIFSASIALQHRGRKIIEIAFSCGYESLSAFYSDFSRYFGQTPKEFRRATNTSD